MPVSTRCLSINRMVSPKVSSKPAREDMSGLVLTSLSRQVITCRYSLLKRSYSFEAFEVPSAKLSYTFQLYCASSTTSLMDQPKLMLKDHISILLRARAILADFSSAWLKSPLAPGHMDRILSSGNKADKNMSFPHIKVVFREGCQYSCMVDIAASEWKVQFAKRGQSRSSFVALPSLPLLPDLFFAPSLQPLSI